MKSPKRIIKFIAYLVFLMGLYNALAVINAPIPERLVFLQNFLPLIVVNTGRLFTVFAGFSLIVLSSSLLKGKKMAMWITCLALVVSAFFHLIKGLDVEESLVSLLLTFLLFTNRKYFTAGSDKPTLVRGLRTFLFSLVFVLVYGIGGYFILGREGMFHFSPWQIVNDVLRMFFLSEPPRSFVVTGHVRWFVDTFYLIGIGSLTYGLLALISPAILGGDLKGDKDEIHRVKDLIGKYGTRSIDAFAFLSGRRYFFYGLNALVAYKQAGDKVLTLGGAIAPKGLTKKVNRLFIQFCLKSGLTPVFFQVAEEELSFFKSLNFKNILIGSEAIIDLPQYSFEGKKKKPLRYAQSVMQRLGYSASLLEVPYKEDQITVLRSISDDWLIHKHGTEKHFSVGAFSDQYLHDSLVYVLVNTKGGTVAFVNFLKCSGGGLVIDLMRHKEGLPPDAMLFLFSSLITWAKEHGYQWLSLGDASLFGVGEESGAKISEKALKLVFNRFNQFYNFKGLWVFKSKFQPRWEKRYLIYPNSSNLVRVVMALIKADSQHA